MTFSVVYAGTTSSYFDIDAYTNSASAVIDGASVTVTAFPRLFTIEIGISSLSPAVSTNGTSAFK